MKRAVGSDAFRDRFTRIFNERWESVFRYLNRLTGDASLASDLGQEAFLRLLERGEMPDDPGAWLIAVANNLRRDGERKRSRRLRILRDAAADRVAPSDPAARPDEAAERGEMAGVVRRALDGLEPRHREVLLLRAEGYRYREIADITGMQPGSVGQTLLRASAALARALGEVDHAPG
jgi:RNA polymerase sigma-70 factor (ECF subfamily)